MNRVTLGLSLTVCVSVSLCVRAETCVVCVQPLLPLQSPFAPVRISRIVSVRHMTLWNTGSVLANKIGLFSYYCSQVSWEQVLDICSGLWLITRMLTWRITLAAYLLWIPTSQGVLDGNVALLNYFVYLEWIGISCNVLWCSKVSETIIKADASDLMLFIVFLFVLHLSSDSSFVLMNKATGFCIVKRSTRCLDVRWSSNNRLFVTSTKKCLGAQGKTAGAEVSTFDCDNKSDLQKWECRNETLLALKGQQLYIEVRADDTIALSRTAGPNNQLTITGTSSGACSRTYRGTVKKSSNWFEVQLSELGAPHYTCCWATVAPYITTNNIYFWVFFSVLYTIEGNAFGKPCMFPFLYKDRWYGDCTTSDSSSKRAWCAIGTRYEQEQWGYCPTTCE